MHMPMATSKTLAPTPVLRHRCKPSTKRGSLRLAPHIMDATSPAPAPPSHSCHRNRHQHWQVQKLPPQRRSWKRWTIATTTRQRGRTSRGEPASRRMRYSGYHHWSHLPLVRIGGVLTLCFVLCVVRVASPRAPGPAVLLYNRFDVDNGQPILPHSHLAMFLFVLVLFIFGGPSCVDPRAHMLFLSNYYLIRMLWHPYYSFCLQFRSFVTFLSSSTHLRRTQLYTTFQVIASINVGYA